jgi:hypothetical protein
VLGGQLDARARAARAAGRVAHDVAVLLEVREEHAQHREGVVDRLGRQVAGGRQFGDVRAHVGCRDRGRPHRAQERLEAHGSYWRQSAVASMSTPVPNRSRKISA